MKKSILLLCIVLGSISCVTVKEIEKNKLNDAEMSLSVREIEHFEQSFYLYREGSGGANGSKSGGGCGCN